MAIKVYIANTPLILQDAAGKEFRVEIGEAVRLTPEQYQDVAAHVTAAAISDEALAESGYMPDGETPLAETLETPSETPEAPAEPAPTKRGRAKAEA